ncbi:pyridoxal phosphate-dependent aminotransferase [Prosthecomicrobium hirschii]|uniref:pyridoxal phosphate-dependent aminotransferase n=1 Tax=Prosthecodimorpha hirschii TaxID=665126 RepID=UPI002220174F|nr:aminotransferase class I/II-fold pyridoxal phosphate-dependent enzyme [Prosthecomicrobium hirschii]MCW1838917.1 aminotransferase class I/II-fold pyridoxal phosphate-dependent enzyme [Prosthecomicrobium hirschii]
MPFQPSNRSRVEPFIAMEVLAAAVERERQGHRVVRMEVGQPGAPAPKPVVAAAQAAIASGRLGYTEAMGIRPLREAIAGHYAGAYGLDVSPDRIAVTAGSSGAFSLAFLAAFDVGQRVAMPTPGYPAYRNLLGALGIEAVEIETAADTRWALTPDMIRRAHAQKALHGILIASPANPTGTMYSPEALKALVEVADELGLWFISDEIYHGLVFAGEQRSALEFSPRAIVVNSFSKYYCMTGWRIGWMVLPEMLVRPVDRLAQNLYLSNNEISQRAAVAAFDPASAVELDATRAVYAANRAVLIDRLPRIGFDELLPVDGAFYVYASVKRFSNDSLEFARRMLVEAGVAATPGPDFDAARGHGFIRFSFAGTEADIVEAADRLQAWLK